MDFLNALFGLTSEENRICLSALDNERGGPLPPRENTFDQASGILKFVERYGSEPGRGTFFCVGAVKSGAKRLKANIQEIVCLHADIDFRDIEEDRATVEKRLAQLPIPPSITVFSGNGIHAYWLLKEPITMDSSEAIERVEEAYKRLAVILAADMHVCHIAALMRMPGSHNTKQGKMTPVEVLTFDSERRFELDDIEEQMLDVVNPIFARKDRVQSTPENNPLTLSRIAEINGIRPRTDVDSLVALLAPGNVHTSQVKITSALLTRGEMTPDEVIDFMLCATMAMSGQHNLRYQEAKERRKIKGMCDSWLKKHPELIERKVVQLPPPKAAPKQTLTREPDGETPSGPGEVISLAQKRKERAPQAAKKEKDIHRRLANTALGFMRERGEDILIVDDTLWRYRDSIWSSAGDGKAWLDAQVQETCEHHSVDIVPANKLIGEARQYILRDTSLRRDAVAWDAHGKVPTRSGLVDPRTDGLEPALAGHYCTWRMPTHFDPEAKCPRWLQMLEDAFADRDPETRAALIAVIQDCAGAGLIDNKPRALSRALLFIGGANTGKSALLEVLGGMYGRDHIAVELDTIEGTHALMPFLRRRPWVLHEAFSGKKWHQSSTIKAIITGEPININPKNREIISKRVTAPIFWGSNHSLTISESTNAIAARVIQIQCKREFIEGVPVGVAAEAFARGMSKPSELVLAEELPGLLNWAMVGLKRGLERGKIEVPPEVKDAAEEIREGGNPVARFIKECCYYDPYMMVTAADFSLAFLMWNAEQNSGTQAWGNNYIGTLVRDLHDPLIATDRKKLKTNSLKFYCGIAFNREGLAYQHSGYDSEKFRDRITKATNPNVKGAVFNRPMPTGYDTVPAVITMRKASASLSTAVHFSVDSDPFVDSAPDADHDPDHDGYPLGPKGEPRF